MAKKVAKKSARKSTAGKSVRPAKKVAKKVAKKAAKKVVVRTPAKKSAKKAAKKVAKVVRKPAKKAAKKAAPRTAPAKVAKKAAKKVAKKAVKKVAKKAAKKTRAGRKAAKKGAKKASGKGAKAPGRAAARARRGGEGTQARQHGSQTCGQADGGDAGRGQEGSCTKKDSPKADGCQHSCEACRWEVDSEARDGNYDQPGYSACLVTRSTPAGYRAGSLALPDIRALTGCVFEALQALRAVTVRVCRCDQFRYENSGAWQSGVASVSLVGCEKRIADRPRRAYRSRGYSRGISLRDCFI
jgi:hypothetical protein